MIKIIYATFLLIFLEHSITECGVLKGTRIGVVDSIKKPLTSSNQNNYAPSNNYYGNFDNDANQKKPLPQNVNDHNYKNTTWYIENEDYLSPNHGEHTQNSQKQNKTHNSGSRYRRGYQSELKSLGTSYFDPKSKTHTIYARSPKPLNASNTGFVDLLGDNKFILVNQQEENESLQNNLKQKEGQKNIHKSMMSTDQENAFQNVSVSLKGKKKPAEIFNSSQNQILLESDSIKCLYSNIKDSKLENRSMRCNDKDCSLKNISKKSSLWVCDNIKCNVANVNTLEEDLLGKKLLECSMDARNIIKVPDKPPQCGPNEKIHKGRCRSIFTS